MNPEITAKAQSWLNSNIDAASKAEIKALLADENQNGLIDSFYKDLEFGTGGMRGVMGIGSNRVNKYTIGKATQGLCNYIKKAFPGEEIKVAVAHDSRNKSDTFAKITADVFSANGFKVYFFSALRPTPELSFAVRHFGCKSGVVITASHNPKEYNGYKAYWDDGAQVVPPHDKGIIKEVNALDDLSKIQFEGNDSLIEIIGKEVDDVYLDRIAELSLAPDAIARQKDLKIVFSSIHGTGITLVPPVLAKMGFENVNIVEEQAEPDGNFPTVVYPNPEETEAMSLALSKAEAIDADLVMATDPDSDRVGIGIKDENGKFYLLNGNQTGSLLIHYLLTKWKENGKLGGEQFTVKTIVTTDLIQKISEHYGVPCHNTLTGFKWVASIIKELEGKKTFIGGGEESYGYLIGDFVRDKDAISSCAILAEMTAYFKDQGKGLKDILKEIALKYGLYLEGLKSLTKKGQSGSQEIAAMMKDLRNNPPQTLGGSKLIKFIDYSKGISTDVLSGNKTIVNLPSSNVLQFFTADGSKISARPSGTEPKIKFYFSVNSPLNSLEQYNDQLANLQKKIENIQVDFGL